MLALAGTSDLVKGVYEGGLKTWECALDLVAYLAEQKDSYEGKKVLEVNQSMAITVGFCCSFGGGVVSTLPYHCGIVRGGEKD